MEMKRVFSFSSFQNSASSLWVSHVFNILNQILSGWHLRWAFPLSYIFSQTHLLSSPVTAQKSYVVTDPTQMTQRLTGLFTKGKCKRRVYFIQKFEFLSWLSSFHIDEWEKSRPFLWLRLLGMKTFRIHQTSTFRNPWVSSPSAAFLCFYRQCAILFLFFNWDLENFFPQNVQWNIKLGCQPQVTICNQVQIQKRQN